MSTPDWPPAKVLLTGGNGGIGRATVGELTRAGHRVVSLDVSADAPPEGCAAALACDLRDPDACSKAVNQAADVLGGLDTLIHSAGITRDGVSWKLTREDWDAVIGVNLSSAFHLSRAATPLMRKEERGAMVFVSSINGERGKFGQSAYAASKSGLHGLARSLARELGHFDIRVNVVAPGMITTPMTESLPEDIKEAARKESCLGRLGEPDDVAAVISFLVSPASRHVTGQVLRVDGGQYL